MLWTTKGAYRYEICLLLIYTIPMLILRFVRFEPLCNRSSLPTSSSSMLYKQISRRTANILLALAGCAFALALRYSRYSSCSAACFFIDFTSNTRHSTTPTFPYSRPQAHSHSYSHLGSSEGISFSTPSCGRICLAFLNCCLDLDCAARSVHNFNWLGPRRDRKNYLCG